MSESRPILFNDEMVRAILEGRKTQTRRVLTPQPTTIDGGWGWKDCMIFNIDLSNSCLLSNMCPYGQPGDLLWVREAWMPDAPCDATWPYVEFYGCKGASLDLIPKRYRQPKHCLFRATWDGHELVGWKPSIHMPRWASRLVLVITDVRVQRLQDISEEDCWSEGIEEIRYAGDEHGNLRGSVLEDYRALWDSISKPGAKWEDNPWVWAISFQRVEA